MEERTAVTYTKKERNNYLIGMAGQNIIYNIIGAGLAYFFQFTLLIPAIAVGVIMAIARVFDAFNDPIMGSIVDKTRSKWGKCRPYLLIAPGIILIATVLCFVSFGIYGQGSKALDIWIIAWAAISYILFGLVYTMGDIPLWSVTAVMTEDNKDRDKLLSLARVAGGIGAAVTLLGMQPVSLGIGEAIGKSLNNAALGERYGFLVAAIGFAVLGCLLFQLVGVSVKERIRPTTKGYTLKENLTIMWKNKPFRQILLSGILSSARMLLSLCAMAVITYYYASKSPILAFVYMALLGGGMFVGMFGAAIITPKLLKRFTKKKLYNGSCLVGIVPYLLIFIMYLAAPTRLTDAIFVIICFFLFLLSGATLGLSQALQSLMIADCVDYEEYTNGTRPDAVFFSGQTFIAKLTAGIATIISSIAYSIVGFSDAKIGELNAFIEAGGIPRLAPQYGKYMMVLFFLVSIPPAISAFLSVLPTWKYSLDDDEHRRILAELIERRHGEDSEVPAAVAALEQETAVTEE